MNLLHRNRFHLVVGAIATASTMGCNDPRVRKSDEEPETGHERYYSAAEQERIATASKAYWVNASAADSWDAIAIGVFRACGLRMALRDAFFIASFHPRMAEEPVWRGALETAILRYARFEHGTTETEPACRLIRVVLGLKPVASR